MLPIIYSERFLKHHTGRFHPERPERLSAVVNALQVAPWSNQLDWQQPNDQRDVQPWLETVHRRDYIERVRDLAKQGGGMLDPDTVVSVRSYE
ncbi:MAG: histone deacetylase, partial [Spirulinaceae cyanobacterium RM2_2_10]|nr:histone deacetylase [Spirulinaceae cyanobacterium RM2_2_10]